MHGNRDVVFAALRSSRRSHVDRSTLASRELMRLLGASPEENRPEIPAVASKQPVRALFVPG